MSLAVTHHTAAYYIAGTMGTRIDNMPIYDPNLASVFPQGI